MLTQRQILFIDAYLETRHVTNSAIKAGYSAATAAAVGSKLLRLDKIQAAIKARDIVVQADNRVTVRNVINELAKYAFVDPVDFKRLSMTMKNKIQYLDMLCRHLSIYNDKLQVEHDVSDDLKKTLTSISSQHSNADLIPEAEEVILIDDDSLIDPFALEDPENLPEIEEKLKCGLKSTENMGRSPTDSVQRLNTDALIRE